jgi:hypothetical protein
VRKIFLFSIIFLIVGVLAGFTFGRYYTKVQYNPDYRVPDLIEKIARNMPFFSEKYPRVAMKDIPQAEGKAEVLGKVTLVEQEPDGDIHVVLADGSNRLVTEIIPEMKINPPKEGDYILARGLIWFDKSHNWWELHPLISWQKVQ